MSSAVRVLIVDDDELFRRVVVDILKRDRLEVSPVGSLANARDVLDSSFRVVILDQRLPDGTGLDFARELRSQDHKARILMVTGHPEVADTEEALKLRIDDYLTKPVTVEALRFAVLRSLETYRLEQLERVNLRQRDREARLVGSGLGEVRQLVEVAASSSSSVLITGPTGSGKGVVAKTIHSLCHDGGPFVKVNCAALPASLIESELFGVERGAYTGASVAREGLFELAHGGTLFLDEIAELEIGMQAKLLGALDDRVVRRVGGSRQRPFSVRIIAATNREAEAAVSDGHLRQDLYFRLAVLHIAVPPLARRVGDLGALVEALLHELSPGRSASLAEGELDRLSGYAWPGNVRELRNILERSLLLHEESALEPSSLLPAGFRREAAPPPVGSEQERAPQTYSSLRDVQDAHIREVLEACGGNRTRAADILGVGLSTLRRRLREIGPLSA